MSIGITILLFMSFAIRIEDGGLALKILSKAQT